MIVNDRKKRKKYPAVIQVSLDHTGGEISLLKIQMPFKLLFLHHNVFICHSEAWKTWFRNRALTLPCCCSVAKSRPTLCDPIDCSTPGFPVLHYFMELAQSHVHWVDDAIQSSHPLSLASLQPRHMEYLSICFMLSLIF